MRLCVYPNEHFVEAPAPIRICPVVEPAFPDLSSEHRAKPVPPEPYGFVADTDTAFEQKIFDLTERQRITDVHHHSQADDLGQTVEISERI